MDRRHYEEMKTSFRKIEEQVGLKEKRIYLFGHCNATEKLADLILENGYRVEAILDNNHKKHGKMYQMIPIQDPSVVVKTDSQKKIVFIVTRFYEAMYAQLRNLGFDGEVRKLVDYNTYAEYSLSFETIERKRNRVSEGMKVVRKLEEKYPGVFRIFCPLSALGDICFCMSYLPYFQQKRGFSDYVICVTGSACADVAALYGAVYVEAMEQAELDAAIQAEIYIQDKQAFVAHQDRPYVVDLSRALYIRKISLEKIYCCGVFNLPWETRPMPPTRWTVYGALEQIQEGHAVILAPYAKSVTALSDQIWEDIAQDYLKRGYQVFTNIIDGEQPLEGTIPISPGIREMKSVVERAGIFVGIRSGLCDVIRTADCRKIALYPDYQYCDTEWKAIDIYAIDEFENIVVEEGFIWRNR